MATPTPERNSHNLIDKFRFTRATFRQRPDSVDSPLPFLDFNRNFAIAAFTAAAVCAVVAGLFLVFPGRADAHQPDGLRISQASVEDFPCPYGHDSGCEVASFPQSPNPYAGGHPDAQINADIIGNVSTTRSAGLHAIRNVRTGRWKLPSGSNTVTETSNSDDSSDVRAALTSDITGLPWVADGLTTQETVTRNWLSFLQNHEPALAQSLTGMPFLQDYNPGDQAAIESVVAIAFVYDDLDFVTETLAISELADGGGLDNDEAKIVSTFALAYAQGLDFEIELLAEYGQIEESTVTGRYNNSITFCVIRLFTDLDNSAVMTAAKDAVSHAEELMGKALPTDFVAIAIHDGPADGVNNSISIRIDRDLDTNAVSDRLRLGVIAHEIGHYYWYLPGREYDWLAEGAAEYIAAYAEKKKYNDADLYTHFQPCPYYRTVEHLRADAPSEFSSGIICNYSLGERLFINLGRSMTDTAFKTAFRKLHRDAEASLDNGNDPGELLLQAFCSTCASNPRNLGATGFTLARRYGERILTDRTTATGTVPRLGQVASTTIEGVRDYTKYFGFAEIPASSPDPRRWVGLFFDNVTNPPDTVRIRVKQYHEDREAWYDGYQERTVHSADNSAQVYPFLGSQNPRPTGHHWVQVFNASGQLIAQVEYQVMP